MGEASFCGCSTLLREVHAAEEGGGCNKAAGRTEWASLGVGVPTRASTRRLGMRISLP